MKEEKNLKKTLVSLLFSAALVFSAMPMLQAEASQMEAVSMDSMRVETGTFGVEGDEPLISGSYSDMQNKPAAELNTEAIYVPNKAVVIDGKAYMFMEVAGDTEDYSKSYYFYAYDEDGENVYSSSYSSYDGVRVVRFQLDSLSGSKKMMVAVYEGTSDENGYSYDLIAAKNVTVAPVEWAGGSNLSVIRTASENTSVSLYAYLPEEVDGKDVAIGLYDGNTLIGVTDSISKHSSSSVEVTSVLGGTGNGKYYVYLDKSRPYYSGQIQFSRLPAAGKVYSLKAVADGKVFNLGEVRAEGGPYVFGAYSSGEYQGKQAVVNVYAGGYRLEDLTVELRDSETGQTVATSTGAQALQTSKTNLYYKLATDKTLEELNGARIVVLAGGKQVYRGNSFSLNPGIADAYYDHVQDAVVARTYAIPDGVLVTASVENGSVEYKGEGEVHGDILVLKFYKDGVPTRLPDGYNSIDYKFTLPDMDEDSDFGSVDVFNVDNEVNSLAQSYFFVGEQIAVDFTVDKGRMIAEKGFTAVLEKSGEQVGQALNLSAAETTRNNVACWRLTGSFPPVEAGNYSLEIRNGTEEADRFTSYSIYVMDPTKVYGRVGGANSYTDAGISRSLNLSIPYGMKGADGTEWYDRNLFALIVTDVAGNDVGMTLTMRNSTSNTNMYFDMGNVAPDLCNVNVQATYNGQPVYDITKIAENKPINTKVNPNSSYTVSSYVRSEGIYTYEIGFRPTAATFVGVVKAGTMDVVKNFELPANVVTYFTEDMLSGLEYNNAKEAYTVYFYEIGGNGIRSISDVYFGIQQQEQVTNGIGRGQDGSYYLFQDGVVNTAYTGLYEWKGNWVCIVSGKVEYSYTGLVLFNDIWWYVSDGVVDFDYTGLVEYGGAWWCVSGGSVNFDYTGLVFFNGVWWYVTGGMVDFNYTGLVLFNDVWWCVIGGAVNFDYTGLVLFNDVWWYVTGGAVDFNYVGLVFYGDAWWCVSGGSVNFGYTGLVEYGGTWWYVTNGLVDFNYTGLLYFNDTWWCVIGGAVNFDYAGLVEYDGIWWYVSGGSVNFAYTGLVELDGIWWYVTGGQVDFGYTGLVELDGIWWYVSGGMVSGEAYGLVEFNGQWWYVAGGRVDFEYTGAVQHVDGVTYNVVNGVVVF